MSSSTSVPPPPLPPRLNCGLVMMMPRNERLKPPMKAPVPLISVNVNASVVHAVAQVEVTQVYVNKEEQPIEAIYYFPVNPDGAVTHFQAELEGRVIKGSIKPKEEARAEYDKAVENQTTAFLGEETKADIFKVRVGFLKPGSQVKIIIGYVTEVKNEPGSNTIRFYIPTTIAPRYVSPSEMDEAAKDIKNMKFSHSSPAPLSIKVAVSLQGGIRSIDSPTHKVRVNRSETIPENEVWHKAIVELDGETTEMDRDFVLNILPEDVHKPRLYSEKLDGGSTAVMIHMVPSFKLEEQKSELIFVLDRSGSMQGQSIELAREALLLFLHSMPADCHFNVIGFGSRYQSLFSKSVKYDDESLAVAVDHARNLRADLGGTEILTPLRTIYDGACFEGYLRQIFILTDGEVSNTDAVLGIAKANAHKARVFALGIGSGASHHLVEGVAKAGGGTAAFVSYNESVDKKVLNQLKNALQPSLSEIELVWEGVDDVIGTGKPEKPRINKEKTLMGYNKPVTESVDAEQKYLSPSYQQSPKKIPPIYDGSQLLVFGMFQQDKQPTGVVVKAQSPDGPLSLKIEYSPANDIGSTGMLHRLAAVNIIRELELETAALKYQRLGQAQDKEETLKKLIIDLACRNGVTSKYTSFVAVDLTTSMPSSESWVMETRHVPSQYTQGWHGGSAVPVGRASPKKCSGFAPVAAKSCPRKSSVISNQFTPSPDYRMSRTDAVINREVKTASTSSEESLEDEWDDSDERVLGKVEGTTKQKETPIVQLISLQSFDGSFKLTCKLIEILGKSVDMLKEVATKHRLSEEVFATALAVSFFVTKLPDEKDRWELVVLKARKWLQKNVPEEQLESILKAAENLLTPAEHMTT